MTSLQSRNKFLLLQAQHGVPHGSGRHGRGALATVVVVEEQTGHDEERGRQLDLAGVLRLADPG